MAKTITHKKQGNGQDSWIIRDGDKLPKIVFIDPSTDTPKAVKLTDTQLEKLLKLLGE